MTTPTPNALATLLALGKNKPAPKAPQLDAQVNDPAIMGAKRDKNTVKLGRDPKFEEIAAHGSKLRQALDQAEADFTVVQSQIRDYGKEKREKYNDAFKADVTTVAIPYTVENDDGTKGVGYVQAICTNKYSVQQEVVLNHQEALGDLFPKLFTVDEVKLLKPNAEELFKGVLRDVGVDEENIASTMAVLFETKKKVSTTEAYEKEVKAVPEPVKTVLAQAVTRQQPGLKFPKAS